MNRGDYVIDTYVYDFEDGRKSWLDCNVSYSEAMDILGRQLDMRVVATLLRVYADFYDRPAAFFEICLEPCKKSLDNL